MSNGFKPLKGFWPQFFYVLWMPVFFIGFMIIFRPDSLCQYLGEGTDRYSFRLSILSAIILAVMAISRLVQIPARDKIDSQSKFIACSALECLFIFCFSALFLTLALPDSISYFDTLYKLSSNLLPILLIGYAIAVLLLLELFYKHNEPQVSGQDVRLKFYDSNHLLKLTISASSVLYIEADENYIKVCYQENDTLKQKTLRSSMKTIDEMCQSCGIVRCHRSFFVNSAHIKLLRKDPEGVIYLELDHKDTKHIPVSKRYYDKLSEML